MRSDRSVVILHEGWGRTDGILAVAGRFERRGFRVEVPDLYGGLSPGRGLVGMLPQLRRRAGPAFDCVARALGRLGPRTAVIGLSLGAAIALRVPTPVPIVAAYGHVPRVPEASGPILGIFGTADGPLRASGRRLERIPEADVRWFEGAGHSFLAGPVPVRLPRVGPHPVAADAWAVIERFVDHRLADVVDRSVD